MHAGEHGLVPLPTAACVPPIVVVFVTVITRRARLIRLLDGSSPYNWILEPEVSGQRLEPSGVGRGRPNLHEGRVGLPIYPGEDSEQPIDILAALLRAHVQDHVLLPREITRRVRGG